MSTVVDARLAAVEARLAALEARLAGGTSGAPATSSGGGGGGSAHDAIASDRQLDSEWGSPVVKKDPKRWLERGGDSFVGSTMSQCPSDYLQELASLHIWMADKDDEQGKTYTDKSGRTGPASAYGRRMAALARGWARRNQGKTAAPAQADFGPSADYAAADDDIPF